MAKEFFARAHLATSQEQGGLAGLECSDLGPSAKTARIRHVASGDHSAKTAIQEAREGEGA